MPGRRRGMLIVGSAFAALALTGCTVAVEGDPVPVANPTTTTTTPPAPSTEFPLSGPIQAGDCVVADDFEVVGCSQEHEIEVLAFDQLPDDFGDTYPTGDTILPEVEHVCREALPAYVGSPDVDATRIRESVYWPSRSGWSRGERWYLCAATEVDPDDDPISRTGSLAGVLSGGLGEFQACTEGAPSDSGPVRIVSCAQPHRGEAVPGVLSLGSRTDSPPSADDANARGEPHCTEQVNGYLGNGQSDVVIAWRYPLADSWPNGFTNLVCYAEFPAPRTGPAAGS